MSLTAKAISIMTKDDPPTLPLRPVRTAIRGIRVRNSVFTDRHAAAVRFMLDQRRDDNGAGTEQLGVYLWTSSRLAALAVDL